MNNIDLEGRAAVVTGGADGIGRAITERLLISCARVAMWDISQKNLDAMQEAHDVGDRLIDACIDVTNPEQVAGGRDKALAAMGKIDILVCNAGIAGPAKKSWEYSYEEWRSVVNLDLDAVFVCCQSVISHMMDRGYGRIVNIASNAAIGTTLSGTAFYAATKAEVLILTKRFALELGRSGITVNTVCPGWVVTDMTRGSATAEEFSARVADMGERTL